MHRHVALPLMLVALLVAVTGCGSDDENDGRDRESLAKLELPPLGAQDRGDGRGAAAHSEAPSGNAPVAECSAINREGRNAAAPFNGFHDITVRGIGCEQAATLIERTYKTWNGKALDRRVSGFACQLLYGDDVNATVRCVKGGDTFRFTFQRKQRKKAYTIDTRECGTFDRYYDITSRDVPCQATATAIADGSTRWASLRPGRPVVVVGYRCSVLYTEGRHKTIRCTASGRREVRFSLATRPSTGHPRRPPTTEEAAVRAIPQRQATGRGLSTNVVTVCPPYRGWLGITSKGVSCDLVDRLLARGGKGLRGLARGRAAKVSAFTCRRIDKGGQAPTVRCVAPGGVSFRGSLVRGGSAGATTSTAATSSETTSTPTETSKTTSQ